MKKSKKPSSRYVGRGRGIDIGIDADVDVEIYG